MAKTRVLWASRNPPLPAQIRALKARLGKVEVIQGKPFYANAEDVINHAKAIGATIIVPVLPMGMVAQLLPLAQRAGITVLWAEMKQIDLIHGREPVPGRDFDPDQDSPVAARNPDGSVSWKIMRFVAFHRIKAIKLELEPW